MSPLLDATYSVPARFLARATPCEAELKRRHSSAAREKKERGRELKDTFCQICQKKNKDREPFGIDPFPAASPRLLAEVVSTPVDPGRTPWSGGPGRPAAAAGSRSAAVVGALAKELIEKIN